MKPTAQRANSQWCGMLHSLCVCRESTACLPSVWSLQEHPGLGQLLVKVGKGKVEMGPSSPLLVKYKDILLAWTFGGVDPGFREGKAWALLLCLVSCSMATVHSSLHLSLDVISQRVFGSGVIDTQHSAVGAETEIRMKAPVVKFQVLPWGHSTLCGLGATVCINHSLFQTMKKISALILRLVTWMLWQPSGEKRPLLCTVVRAE